MVRYSDVVADKQNGLNFRIVAKKAVGLMDPNIYRMPGADRPRKICWLAPLFLFLNAGIKRKKVAHLFSRLRVDMYI